MGIFKRIFKKDKAPVIIGIHGLNNKPPRGLLRVWWKKSIMEGLRKVGFKNQRFDFEMAYWADLMYEKPKNPNIKDPEHELFIEEPYIKEPIPKYKIKKGLKHYYKWTYNKLKSSIFLSRKGLANYEVLFDMVVRSSFKDLDAYFSSDTPMADKLELKAVKQKVRQRLLYLIRKNKDRKIIIVAHSMGSLIAYDVLTNLPEQYKIDVFISCGSPIGLPVIREKVARSHGWQYAEEEMLPTPNVVNQWINFSDLEDHFAVFNDLSSYYSPNTKGIAPKDIIIDNDYKNWITGNAHKSFGYLRVKDMAQIIQQSLFQENKNIWQKGKEALSKNKVFGKLKLNKKRKRRQ